MNAAREPVGVGDAGESGAQLSHTLSSFVWLLSAAARPDGLMSDLISENLKATVGQVQRYTLVALSSAALFAVLTLPSPAPGDVKWQLLGVPVAIAPPLALVILYLVYLGSCLLADNMLLHIRDLAAKLDDLEQTRAVLSYPTILTVSPAGRCCASLLPPALIVFGLAKLYFQGAYELHVLAWLLAGLIPAFTGLLLFLRVQRCLKPNLYPEKKARRASPRQTKTDKRLGDSPD